MRISDWSSDVCSSDLPAVRRDVPADRRAAPPAIADGRAFCAVRRPGARRLSFLSRPDRCRRRRFRMDRARRARSGRSEEHTSELQSLMRISYAVFCLKKNNNTIKTTTYQHLVTYIKQHSNMVYVKTK